MAKKLKILIPEDEKDYAKPELKAGTTKLVYMGTKNPKIIQVDEDKAEFKPGVETDVPNSLAKILLAKAPSLFVKPGDSPGPKPVHLSIQEKIDISKKGNKTDSGKT